MVLADVLSKNTHLMPSELQISQSTFLGMTKELNFFSKINLFTTKNLKSIIQFKFQKLSQSTPSLPIGHKILYAFSSANLI